MKWQAAIALHPARAAARRLAARERALRQRAAALTRRCFYAGYYRCLYGRKYPGAAGLERRIAGLEQRLGRGDIPLARERWEAQYRSANWQYLADLGQVPRYSVLAGYLRFLKPGARVLDIGCGEGVLLSRLDAAACSEYVGIDWSRRAIARAAGHPAIPSRFVEADARDYFPGRRFDAIVFNEVLYYISSPIALVNRYEMWLAPDGFFLISLYAGSARAAAIGRALRREHSAIAAAETGNGASRWMILALGPKRTK